MTAPIDTDPLKPENGREGTGEGQKQYHVSKDEPIFFSSPNFFER